MKMTKASEAALWLLSRDNFLILSHRNPDGDTLGSGSALCLALRRAGKTAYIFENPQITEKYLPYMEGLFASEEFVPEYYVSVDVPAEDMFSKNFSFGRIDLCVDHHPSNPGFGECNLICPEKSACGEIVLEIIESMPGSLQKAEAERLYIAISTDTGCFQYSNTNAATFLAAAKLLECGIDSGELNLIFFRKVSKARIKLEAMIFGGMELYRDGKIAVATVTNEMLAKAGAVEDDCEDLAGLPGRVDTEILGITVRENRDGSSKISLRSTQDDIDCSMICGRFGGGGHKKASGCTIRETPETAKKLLLQVIDEVWQ